MRKHFYAFGSICRGEIDAGSDVDLLACLSAADPSVDLQKFSIYSPERLQTLWAEGNPFAWHLHLESRLLYSSDGVDLLKSFGEPSPYRNGKQDCAKFRTLFVESYEALRNSNNSVVFHLSCIFLSARNFATCASLAEGNPIFSRRSPLMIERGLKLDEDVFQILARARILSTRGIGAPLSPEEMEMARLKCPKILDWMDSRSPERCYE